MERIILTDKADLEKAVIRANEVLDAGGVVLYPTDTLYGLGVDATNEGAIEKVYTIKGRDKGNPLSVIVSDIEMAKEYAEVGDLGQVMFKKLLPGAFTFVMRHKNNLSKNLTLENDHLGIRIPDSYFCVSLAKKFGRPFTTTSANKSGEECLSDVDEIVSQIGEENIDLTIDAGELKSDNGSTVLRVNDDGVEVLREGNINHTALLNVTKVSEE
jgi:L-threonylcarbamoyladenylate synthase